ncbi:MAG: HIT domain-containing protein [Chitinivibrionia bacterium]|nr:HIT domain-containing protein [Chitinivibrionia bacterium]
MKRVYAPWRSEYLRSNRTDECLFCGLAGKDATIDSWIIYKGKHWYVVVNIYPYTSGHVMVVCSRHVERIADLTDEENIELMSMLARTERAVRAAYNPDGINIGANLGKSAGAGIEGHLHVHLVPRWQGDTNFETVIGEVRVISEDLVETYERLHESFE